MLPYMIRLLLECTTLKSFVSNLIRKWKKRKRPNPSGQTLKKVFVQKTLFVRQSLSIQAFYSQFDTVEMIEFLCYWINLTSSEKDNQRNRVRDRAHRTAQFNKQPDHDLISWWFMHVRYKLLTHKYRTPTTG